VGVVTVTWEFLHCGLGKFGHGKSSVYRLYTQLDRRRFVYDTYNTMKASRLRHGWVHLFITHCLHLNLQLHNFDLFRTCRTSSFCTVAWQLARFQLTWRIAQSLGDSGASCLSYPSLHSLPFTFLFQDWLHRFPGLFTDTSQHICYLLFSFFCFTLFSFWFHVVD